MSRSVILFFALFAMNLLLGVIVLTVARGERSSRALRFWGWGLLIYGVGQMFFVFPGMMQRDVQMILGNSFISLSGMLTALGVYEHTPLRLNRPLVIGGWLGTIIALMVCHALRMSVIMDVLIPTAYATLLYSVAAALLITRPPAAARAAARFVAFTFVVVVIMWNLRVIALWISLGGTQDTERADTTMSLFVIAQMLTLVAGTLGLLWIEVRLMEADLRETASTDLLTGVLNRRATRERFDQEAARCRRVNGKFGLVLFDIDHFKVINDTHGHQAGDRVLQEVARAMDQCKRKEDVLGRIGGEEFMVMLPHHDRQDTLRAAQRVRHAVRESTLEIEETAAKGVTISGGIALYPDDGEDWDELYAAADRRMYHAKNSGRDRVEDRSS